MSVKIPGDLVRIDADGSRATGAGVNYGVLGVDVASAATGGTGTSGDPWTGWDTAITWAARTRYVFRSGWFAYATSPNFLLEGIELVGSPGTYLRHTGTGNAFVMDAGSTPGTIWVQNVRVENINLYGNPLPITGSATVAGGSAAVVGTGTAFTTQLAVGDSLTFTPGFSTARSYLIASIEDDTHLTLDRVASSNHAGQPRYNKTRHGFYLRGVRNGVFDRLSVKDVGHAALRTEACVTNSLRMFRSTYHEPTQSTEFLTRPQWGIVTAGRGADWTTTWTIEEPVIEGMQIYGIHFASDSYGNTVTNGTSEGNPAPCVGIQLDGQYNTLVNTDVEANGSSNDIVIAASGNALVNVFATALVTTTGAVANVQILGGRYQDLTLAASSSRCFVASPVVNGTFTDGGSNNLYLTRTGTDLRSQLGIVMPVVTAITPSGAMATDVRLGNLFTVSTTTDCTLSAPSNPVNGMEITYRFDNNSGSTKNITWNAVYESLTGATLPTTIDHTKTLYVTLRYSSFWAKWQCVGVAGG